MRPLLIGNAKITAGLPPFRTVGREPAASVAVMGKKMSQFMKECLLHLGFRDVTQGGVQPDFTAGGYGDAGGRPHPGIPADGNQGGELGRKRKQKCPGEFLKQRIAFSRID
jgi:hypothetical protein